MKIRGIDALLSGKKHCLLWIPRSAECGNVVDEEKNNDKEQCEVEIRLRTRRTRARNLVENSPLGTSVLFPGATKRNGLIGAKGPRCWP